MSGRVVHFEIPFGDGDGGRARDFYRDAFGWNMVEAPDMDYTHALTGPSEDSRPTGAGYINGGLLRRESPDERPIIVIEVDDIDAALAKVEELGGQTVLGRQRAGDIGSAAYFKDLSGNIIGLWQGN